MSDSTLSTRANSMISEGDQVSPDDGIVITQDPIPGFDAARGSRVIIYVGIAPEPDE